MNSVAVRIAGLDVARGIAVLGILAMNIGAFAMPTYAYLGPLAYSAPGADPAAERTAWLLSYLLFDGKMRALFALLFGASLLLLAERIEAAGGDPARWHAARMALLALFGLAHFYLLWVGDILFGYAVAGALLFGFRGLTAPALAALSIAALLVGMALEWPFFGIDLTGPLARFIAESNAAEVAAYRSGYAGGLGYRLGPVVDWPLANLLPGLFEVAAAMLAGMALYRAGALGGGWSRRRLAGVGAAALVAGAGWQAALAAQVVRADYGLAATLFATAGPVWPARLAMAAGLLLLIAGWTQGGGEGMARRWLGVAGRTAFSLYIASSLLLTFCFYRPDAFGSVGRPAQAGVAFAAAALLLIVAQLWARTGRRGPLETAWRRATKAIAT